MVLTLFRSNIKIISKCLSTLFVRKWNAYFDIVLNRWNRKIIRKRYRDVMFWIIDLRRKSIFYSQWINIWNGIITISCVERYGGVSLDIKANLSSHVVGKVRRYLLDFFSSTTDDNHQDGSSHNRTITKIKCDILSISMQKRCVCSRFRPFVVCVVVNCQWREKICDFKQYTSIWTELFSKNLRSVKYSFAL